MMQVNAVIVEDIPAARDELLALLASECPNIKVVATADSCAKGLELIKTVGPDLVFLDVELPDGESFDILRQLNAPNMAIIFTTGHSHYAFRAFEFSAVDYLLKPISPQRLVEATKRATDNLVLRKNKERYQILLDFLGNQETTSSAALDRRIAISNQEIIVFPRIREIILLESVRVYTEISVEHFAEKILIAKNIGEYAQLFEDIPCIMRVHRSYIVNLMHVERFVREDSQAVLKNGRSIPISGTQRDEFLKRWKTCI